MNTATIVNFGARREARDFDEALKAIRLKEARRASKRAPARATKSRDEVRAKARASL